MTWPGGLENDMHINAAARDLVTDTEANPRALADATLHVTVDRSRTLTSVTSKPNRDELRELVGTGGGSGYRSRLQSLVPDDLAQGTPLYFLLDDLPGVTLVGPFAWWLWRQGMAGYASRSQGSTARHMQDVCAGFRSDGLPIKQMIDGVDPPYNLVPALDLAQPDDPLAWHPIPEPPAASPMLRRRRLVDVVVVDGEVRVNSLFRDSMWSPERVEMVVHEYGLHATVDRETMRLSAISADPRVLPFQTCPAAAANVDLLLGEPMGSLRHRVRELVIGTDGCTHLNDALRALAEVPVLLDQLSAVGGPG
ncbi:DUF2889 domain-containing protein [Nonomuraea sp. NPDC049649]|uniref:DUF2889 domain-containing protein n=1 Tax=Nonomuraea sp. NPDC049649 TaxID=3155776 RepID=UPI003412C1EC